jgi:Tol biopolymer transport system component
MKKYLVFAGILFLSSCFPKIIIDYLTVAVPEEGSLRLTQYTREVELVVFPYVEKNSQTGKLSWYAPPLLSISPDGKKIVYLALSNDFKNIYLKDISGGISTIQRTFNRDIMDMSFSPDGKYIVFTERKNNNDNIFMINATEGVAVQQLVATAASELSPSFSADAKDIFFAKSEGDRYFIWSLNIESSLITQYTEGFTPCLAPNGEDLVVTRNSRDGARGEIWMINLKKGTETMVLSDPTKGYSSPRISPDGKRIVCVGVSEGDKTKPQNLDLFLINIDGSQLTQLTFHGGHDVSPIWAPDGNSVFFIAQRGNKDGKANVWKMDLSSLNLK